jgi:hypothetical protein
MLEVQKYLKDHSFSELAIEHGVYASFDNQGYKCSLNYDQVEASSSNTLASQCRGLILASPDGKSFSSLAVVDGEKLNYDNIIPGEMIILSCGFFRFFNYGQGNCAEIDWNNFSVQEKLDGTCIFLYADLFKNEWCVATRQRPDADQLLDNKQYTFRSLFEKALLDTTGLSFLDFTSKLDKDITYCFELTSAWNRVVLDYRENKITLLAARNIKTLEEIDLSTIDLDVPRVKTYPLTTIDEIVEYCNAQNPLEHEGIVLIDKSFNRIKVKNINYVLAHKIKDGIRNDRDFLNLIIQEKDDDVASILPEEFNKRIVYLKENYKKFHQTMMKTFDELKSIPIKKDFAIALMKRKDCWPAPLFCIYDGRMNSIKEFIVKKSIRGEICNSTLDMILSFIG